MQNHALLGSLLALLGRGGHDGLSLQTGYVYACSTQAHGRPGAVVGDVSTAENHDTSFNLDGITLAGDLEEVGITDDAGKVMALHRENGTIKGTHSHKNRVVAREKRLDVVQALAAAQLDAGLLVRALRNFEDSRNLVIEDLVGQSVGGNAVAELAAGALLGLEDSNRMALLGKVVGRQDRHPRLPHACPRAARGARGTSTHPCRVRRQRA